ncbi:glucokinase [Alteribacillus persepolensis]|uniref:Glucokinase n=1 Tax=Alteribacillus persepolensis TaxID=568899 RepID=A0A1G8B0W1_9BACI|nr:ROK family protein [Alteribacillus persepolensis]SDH26922.1 glucokinase [Alteribacillus persepolensis]
MQQTARIGIDIGGTKTLGVVIDNQNNIIQTLKYPTLSQAGDAHTSLLRTVQHTIQQLYDRAKQYGYTLMGIGIACAGIIDDTNRTIRYAQSLGIHDLPIGGFLEEAFQLPVYLCNDTDAAALAELDTANDKHASFLYVSVGTSIGAGIVKHGKLLKGAGEIGHMAVERNGISCSCNHQGCLKHYASGQALEKKAQSKGGSYAAIAMPCIIALAEEGDQWCQQVIKEGAGYLGLALVNAVHLLNIDDIVLGGGVLQKEGMFINEIETYVKRHVMIPARVRKASLKTEASAVGAANLLG